jgi:hypothetical protein
VAVLVLGVLLGLVLLMLQQEQMHIYANHQEN